ncbi:hypothetical protein [Rhodococcus sp. NPDC055024]
MTRTAKMAALIIGIALTGAAIGCSKEPEPAVPDSVMEAIYSISASGNSDTIGSGDRDSIMTSDTSRSSRYEAGLKAAGMNPEARNSYFRSLAKRVCTNMYEAYPSGSEGREAAIKLELDSLEESGFDLQQSIQIVGGALGSFCPHSAPTKPA